MPIPCACLVIRPPPPPFSQLVGLGRADGTADDSNNGASNSNNSGTGKGKESNDAMDKEANVAVDDAGWGIPAAIGKVCVM